MQSEQLVGTNTSDKHMSYPVFKQFSKHILNVRAPYCFLVSWAFGIQSFVETMVFDYHSGSNIFRGTTLQYSDESTMQLRRRQTVQNDQIPTEEALLSRSNSADSSERSFSFQ